jgi:hypothetical protein
MPGSNRIDSLVLDVLEWIGDLVSVSSGSIDNLRMHHRRSS